MTGYREHSYDPWEPRDSGPPARPFNLLQWIGFAFILLAVLFLAAQIVSRFGLIRSNFGDSMIGPASILLTSGTILISSRRARPADPAPELAAARRRWTLIFVAICVAVLGAALVLDFKGA